MTTSAPLCLSGTFCLEKTCGKFAEFMQANAGVFRREFGSELFEGSLNVTVDDTRNMHEYLDTRQLSPAFTILRDHFRDMPDYIGDAQVWHVELSSEQIRDPHACWLFRRIGSAVPPNVLELVSMVGLVETYELCDADPMKLFIFSGQRP